MWLPMPFSVSQHSSVVLKPAASVQQLHPVSAKPQMSNPAEVKQTANLNGFCTASAQNDTSLRAVNASCFSDPEGDEFQGEVLVMGKNIRAVNDCCNTKLPGHPLME
ncbi:hypothetical protein EOD39_10270 [Acipenser ruthenus]|uniref:Uncharacterized protein n=1 Tax=Acipenser ruthenus TaxID=7906 RepID=A0A662YW54_ACIRT|nr:hypothetical protein EOD39_10270 [Acipenser ruthenus]